MRITSKSTNYQLKVSVILLSTTIMAEDGLLGANFSNNSFGLSLDLKNHEIYYRKKLITPPTV